MAFASDEKTRAATEVQLITVVQNVMAKRSYIHTQSVAAATWIVAHNLGFIPNVSIQDSSKRNILTDIEHVDINNLKVLNENEFAGFAYLS